MEKDHVIRGGASAHRPSGTEAVCFFLAVIMSICSHGACLGSVTIGPPGGPTNGFEGVGILEAADNSCSGTAILGGGYVLTAKHCVKLDSGGFAAPGDITFTLGSQTFHGVKLFTNFTADIAVVCIDGKASTSYNLWCPQFGGEAGLQFCAAGFGETDADMDGVWDGDFGHKNVFYNKVDTDTSHLLSYTFNKTSPDQVPGEGIAGPGDSGGGVFIQRDGQLYLAGVIDLGAAQPVDGSSGFNVRVQDYKEQIMSIVEQPEPSSLYLASSGAMVVAYRAIRRRRFAAS